MKTLYKRALALLGTIFMMTAVGCNVKPGASGSALDPKKPVTITIWNYYNGDQMVAFDRLVEEFNTTVGTEKGIVAVTVSQGDVNTLADALLDSVNGKAGAQETPTLASVYSETAYILNQSQQLVALDAYFTEEELNVYVPAFIEEGRFSTDNGLLLFPISKSTEVFAANETDWADFAAATGITLESIQTKEDLTRAAEAYYLWTDSLTPDIAEDGKALYGRDSVANYIYIGNYQLGHELFKVESGKVTVDFDHDTFKTLWDNYYIPYINGYFGAFANFRSEDAKTGKILALTSSSSGVGYLPTQVTLADDSTHDIQMTFSKELRFKDAKENAAVQQGAGYCLLKSTPAQQEGAVEFLKWFTQPERNINFALMSGYSPVMRSSNTDSAIQSYYTGDVTTQKGKNVLNTLLIGANIFANDTPYATKPFNGSKEVRSILESSLKERAQADRESVLSDIASGKSRAEAVAPFATDAYFDAWFENVRTEVLQAVGQ